MKMFKVFLGALSVAVLSLAYNMLVFWIFDFYPDVPVDLGYLSENVYLLIFVKNFLVGAVLMWLFYLAYSNIQKDRGEMKGIMFFALYAIFAFVAFSVGDILLLGSQEGLFVVLTVDAGIEAIIATVPIKFFYG